MAQELATGFERKPSEWLKPSFLLQLGVLLVAIIGGWYMLESRVALVEAAAGNLSASATKIEGQLTAIQATVNTSTREVARLEADIGNQKERISELSGKLAEANAWIQQLNKEVARLQAQVGR